ncbi:MAG TPA: di-heme oxidoredictase family protein [Candidatus Saccharimonadales bacterium]|jgi:CxxC motif-containing protein (DUF1111 family)|nr:di-heme oxidoredictase family protein [Candidatus Saccharimonadales bacterium]
MKRSTAKLVKGIFICATVMAVMSAAALYAQTTSGTVSTTTVDTTGSTSTQSTFTTFTTTDSTTVTASDTSVDTTVPSGVSTASSVFDPGPRPGAPTSGAGNPIANLPVEQFTFWVDGLIRFSTPATPNGKPDTAGNPTLLGLGPSFNGESCFQCHSQPSIGGTSPQVNPQFAAAKDHGATNTVPIFLSTNGPVREARFIQKPDGSLDGGVHELFTIQGRDDAPLGCQIAQPDFQTQVNNNNIALRIPIATFGEGFVENTPDLTFEVNLTNLGGSKVKRGIRGRFNTNGNDGTITKFGWKAQNKSMLLFAGEAANVELGMTNEIFTNEKTTGTGCTTNFFPEDNTHVIVPVPPSNSSSPAGDDASQISSNIENFTIFMRLNAPANQCDFQSPQDSSGNALCNPLGKSALNGKAIFGTLIPQVVNGVLQKPKIGVGCVLCHADTFTTSASNIPQLSHTSFAPFSDYALHHMGSNLADGVNQGVSGPDEFRTAPLWGIGQRIFFLHDGREDNIVKAILDHESPGNVCTTVNSLSETVTINGLTKSISSKNTQTCGSEANAVIENFRALTISQKQDLIDFLRSL